MFCELLVGLYPEAVLMMDEGLGFLAWRSTLLCSVHPRPSWEPEPGSGHCHSNFSLITITPLGRPFFLRQANVHCVCSVGQCQPRGQMPQ